jgi:hypothetical protein
MSTPVQQDELSPDDPKFYAPPRWRNGEIDAQRNAGRPEYADHTDWTSRDEDSSSVNSYGEVYVDVDGRRERSDAIEYRRVRLTALASAVGVLAWIAFCVSLGLSRLDSTESAQAQNVPPPSNSKVSLNERLQAANTELLSASRQIIMPTVVASDASGAMNAALPLAIKITNYTTDTMVTLTGLVSGTTLSAGADVGEGQWRVAVEDLPNARVIPPRDYVGPMTVVAELRRGDEEAIVRTPVRLTWNSPVSDANDSTEPSVLFSNAVDELPAPKEEVSREVAEHESGVATRQPKRVKTHKHATKSRSLAMKRHHKSLSSARAEIQAQLDARPSSLPSTPFNFFASPNFAFERKQFWSSDFQTNADTTRGRCDRSFDCGREQR